MTRHILICTIGATPQVVTETVWSLAHQEPAWIPSEIHIVTTAFRLAFIRASLQASDGYLAGLMGSAFPSVTIHVPRQSGSIYVISPGDAHSDPTDLLQDVSSEQDAAFMGNLILRMIARFANDPASDLHVSLAGGRKTMSAHALMALSLVGRPRDRVSHVLVDPDYEDHPGFWYPNQQGLLLRKDQLRLDPKPIATLDPGQAKVVLVPTPAPLMRNRVGNVADLETMDLVSLIQRANLDSVLQENPHILLNTKNNSIMAGGVTIPLGPKLFAVYRLLATSCKEGWPGVGPEGVGNHQSGWLTFEQIVNGRIASGMYIRDLVSCYLEQAVIAVSGDPDSDEGPVKKWKDEVSTNKVAKDYRDVVLSVQSNLNPNITNLIKNIKSSIGPDAAAVLAPVRKTFRKQEAKESRFGLTIPPSNIQIDS